MDCPLISIIVLTYNNSDELFFTLESIMKCCSCERIEVLIIDSSREEIFAANGEYLDYLFGNTILHSMIRHVQSLPPKGIYPSMNEAVMQAKGLYLNFMNSGDRFHSSSGFIKIYHSLMELSFLPVSSQVDCLYSRTICKSTINKSIDWINPPSNVRPDLRLYWNRLIPPSHQSCFFRSEWHKNNLYNSDLGLPADREIIISSLKKSMFVDVIASEFYLSGASSLNSVSLNNLPSYIKSIASSKRLLFSLPFKLILILIFRNNWELIRKSRIFLLSLIVK